MNQHPVFPACPTQRRRSTRTAWRAVARNAPPRRSRQNAQTIIKAVSFGPVNARKRPWLPGTGVSSGVSGLGDLVDGFLGTTGPVEEVTEGVELGVVDDVDGVPVLVVEVGEVVVVVLLGGGVVVVVEVLDDQVAVVEDDVVEVPVVVDDVAEVGRVVVEDVPVVVLDPVPPVVGRVVGVQWSSLTPPTPPLPWVTQS